jgi:hypothetical protein
MGTTGMRRVGELWSDLDRLPESFDTSWVTLECSGGDGVVGITSEFIAPLDGFIRIKPGVPYRAFCQVLGYDIEDVGGDPPAGLHLMMGVSLEGPFVNVFGTLYGQSDIRFDGVGTFDVTLPPVGLDGPMLNVMSWMISTPRNGGGVVPPWRICFRLFVGPADQFKSAGVGSRTAGGLVPSTAGVSRDRRGSSVVPSGPDLAVLRRLLEQRGGTSRGERI